VQVDKKLTDIDSNAYSAIFADSSTAPKCVSPPPPLASHYRPLNPTHMHCVRADNAPQPTNRDHGTLHARRRGYEYMKDALKDVKQLKVAYEELLESLDLTPE
jgi:hypothetical protein